MQFRHQERKRAPYTLPAQSASGISAHSPAHSHRDQHRAGQASPHTGKTQVAEGKAMHRPFLHIHYHHHHHHRPRTAPVGQRPLARGPVLRTVLPPSLATVLAPLVVALACAEPVSASLSPPWGNSWPVTPGGQAVSPGSSNPWAVWIPPKGSLSWLLTALGILAGMVYYTLGSSPGVGLTPSSAAEWATWITERINNVIDKYSFTTSEPPSRSASRARGVASPEAQQTLRRAQPHSTAPSSSGSFAARANAQNSHHAGIYNVGNTCYMNSTLQALSSCPAFLRSLDLSLDMADECELSVPVSEACGALWAELNTPHKSPRAVHASSVARSLSAPRPSTSGTGWKGPGRSGWNVRTLTGAHEQQDAHELLVVLLDALEDETLSIRSFTEELARLTTNGLRQLLLPPPPPPGQVPLPISPATVPTGNPFSLLGRGGGALNTLVGRMTQCLHCGYTAGVRLTPSPVLELSAPSSQPYLSSRSIDLLSCFSAWAQEEHVEWTCWRCSVHRTLTRLQTRKAAIQMELTALERKLASRAGIQPLARDVGQTHNSTHSITSEADSYPSQIPKAQGRLSTSAKKRKKRKGKSSASTSVAEDALVSDDRAARAQERLESQSLEAREEMYHLEHTLAQVRTILQDNMSEDQVETEGVKLPLPAHGSPQEERRKGAARRDRPDISSELTGKMLEELGNGTGLATPPPEPPALPSKEADETSRQEAQQQADYEALWSALRYPGDRVPGWASTRGTLVRAGEVLAIHLSRSTFSMGLGSGVKNSTYVPFPERLTLPWTAIGVQPEGSRDMLRGANQDSAGGAGWFDPFLSEQQALALALSPALSFDPSPKTSETEAFNAGHPDHLSEHMPGPGAKQKEIPPRPHTRLAALQQLQHDLGTYIGRNMTYRLMAVVVHLGSHGFGHYITFRRRPSFASSSRPHTASSSPPDEVDESSDGQRAEFSSANPFSRTHIDPSLHLPREKEEEEDGWLCISDANVRSCSLSEVLAQRAYLLFYEQVHPPDSDAWPKSPITLAGLPVLSSEQRYRQALKPKVLTRAEM